MEELLPKEMLRAALTCMLARRQLQYCSVDSIKNLLLKFWTDQVQDLFWNGGKSLRTVELVAQKRNNVLPSVNQGQYASGGVHAIQLQRPKESANWKNFVEQRQ